MTTVTKEFRALLPALAFALLLPIPAITFWEDGAGRAFAFAYLFVGCAFMSADCFRPCSGWDGDAATTTPPLECGLVWRIKLTALSLALALAVAVFSAVWFALSGTVDYGVPLLGFLSVIPVWGAVPYFTLRMQKPFKGVLMAMFSIAMIKVLSCVVVRMVYGPNAQADGYMAMSLASPNLLVWLCIAGVVAYTGIFYRLGFRRFQAAEVRPIAGQHPALQA